MDLGRQMWMPLTLGVLAFFVRLVLTPDNPSETWPADAGQILATLFIAVALEGRFLQTGSLQLTLGGTGASLSTRPGGSAAFAALVWPALGLIFCVTAASSGATFAPVADALVFSGIVTLLMVVLLLALWGALRTDVDAIVLHADRELAALEERLRNTPPGQRDEGSAPAKRDTRDPGASSQ